MITVYAIFMCLVHARAGIGHNCSLISAHPLRPQLGVPYESSRYTSLAACKRDIPTYNRGLLPGYVNVCMKRAAPAWQPAD